MFVRTLQATAILGICGFGYYHANRAYKHYKEEKLKQIVSTLRRVDPLPTREEQLQNLKTRSFDLLIVGGGATGCGVALDAASRGLRVAMVEKEDFGAGTSTRSTKLIHGGVRYLENAIKHLDWEQFKLVKEALFERSKFLQNAPHVTSTLPIMIPVYKWWQLPYYWAGAKLYDLVAGSENLESSYFLSKSKALTQFPMLKSDKLVGAIVYYDGQQNDARTNVMLACTAASYGATVANHVEVIDLIKDPEFKKIIGAKVRDKISGEEWNISAKGIINACGPFSDKLRKLDNSDTQDLVVPSAGVHVVLPNYYSPQNMGLLDPATSDGRVIFFLPWNNNTIAGTTDSPIAVTDRPKPLEQEIHWILHEISNYLSSDVSVQRGDVLAAWAGIRPLVRDLTKKDTKSLSRNHVIEVSDSNLITIAGGKWTTYRRMAEDTVDVAIDSLKLMPLHKNSLTSVIKVIGGENYTPTSFIKLIQQFGIDRRVALHLINSYGDRAFEVAKLGKPTGNRWPVIGKRLTPTYFYIDGEIHYAVRNEYATTLLDIIARRTPLAFQNANSALDALPNFVKILSEELGWDEDKQKMEIEEAKKYLETMGIDSDNEIVHKDFTSLELIKWRKLFGELDNSHKGVITISQLQEQFSAFDKNIDIDKLNELLKKFSHQESLNLSDFLEMMSYAKHLDNPQPFDKALVGLIENLEKGINIERSGGGV